MDEPRYRQIAADIRHRIETGRLRPGDRVPSARQITREWGAAIATATRVLAALREEGLVQATPGTGTVVAASVPVTPRTVRRRPGRPVESNLTRERIVVAAVAVADAEGLDAVSMRRVAVELGASTMALYGHVPGKAELVRLMVDAVAEPGRAPLDRAVRARWRLVRRHPWIARTGYLLHPVDRTRVAAALAGYVQGMAAYLDAEDGSAVPPHIDALFEFGLGLMLTGLAHRHR